jgi:hypothetical protein
MTIYFDDSLPKFAALILKIYGETALSENFFLRDANGKLTFIVNETEDFDLSKFTTEASLLEPYVDQSFAISTADQLFDDRLKNPIDLRSISLNHHEFRGIVKLIDRRMVGADWLRTPIEFSTNPPRIAFSSIKGGVGRSTALCVLAAHLALNGKRVLAVDMDLEAPGLGNMLLPGATLPEFGLLDYLVETSLIELPDSFFSDIVGSSWIGGGLGRVDVIPAIGRRSLETPQNVLAKIARAYLADSPRGQPLTFTDQLNGLLDRVVAPNQYDAILLDARAGLHETTAAAVVGMGAHVFLFGIDQPQTFAGYDLLLSHLGTLPRDAGDWPSRLTFVQAKNPGSNSEKFSDSISDVYNKYFSITAPSSTSKEEKSNELKALSEEFLVEWADDTSDSKIEEVLTTETPSVISIYENIMFHSFDPVSKSSQLEQAQYQISFGEFLNLAVASLGLKIDSE